MIKITTPLAKKPIEQQFPEWKGPEMRSVAKSEHDNRTVHLKTEMVVRLPSGADYAAQGEKDALWMPFWQSFYPYLFQQVAIGKPSKGVQIQIRLLLKTHSIP